MSKEISVPDNIYNDAQAAAQRLGITPEEFIADAAQRMAWETMTEEEVVERINKVCEEVDTSVDPVLYALQLQTLEGDEW